MLRGVAREGVRFVGEVDDVAPWLRAADLFVLPSAAEGLSNALLEAMATALPVVVTRVGGAVDVVEHARSGYLVDVDDEPELLRSLVLLLDPKRGSERRALGRGARDRVVRDYSLESVASRLGDLYEDVLHGRSGERTTRAVAVGGRAGEDAAR